MDAENELKIEYVDVDELIPAEYNPRRLTEEDRQAGDKGKHKTLRPC